MNWKLPCMNLIVASIYDFRQILMEGVLFLWPPFFAALTNAFAISCCIKGGMAFGLQTFSPFFFFFFWGGGGGLGIVCLFVYLILCGSSVFRDCWWGSLFIYDWFCLIGYGVLWVLCLCWAVVLCDNEMVFSWYGRCVCLVLGSCGCWAFLHLVLLLGFRGVVVLCFGVGICALHFSRVWCCFSVFGVWLCSVLGSAYVPCIFPRVWCCVLLSPRQFGSLAYVW